MKNHVLWIPLLSGLLLCFTANAQRLRPGLRQKRKAAQVAFKPFLQLSAGYGFPNLDNKYLPAYYNAYYGQVARKGTATASLDYRFSRRMSLGLMVTHASVSAPYYDSFSGLPAFNAQLNNWGFMLNIYRYIGRGVKLSPYLHTALGFNTWEQKYTDPAGNKIVMPEADLPGFSRQFALGTRFTVSKHSSLFLEAGYGKYILAGGVSLRF